MQGGTVQIAVIYMASGFGKRFGRNKLLEPVNGKALYLHGLEMFIRWQEEGKNIEYKEKKEKLQLKISLVLVSQWEEILTFGPVCIAPEYQRRGYGKQLMEHSFEQAVRRGYDVIVIFGSPANYAARGFKSCKRYGVCSEDGRFPAAMMVKELVPGVLDGRRRTYHGSPVMEVSEAEAERYDGNFDFMEKKYRPSQEEFFIMSQAFLS